MRTKRSAYTAVRTGRRKRERPGAHVEVHPPEHAIHTWREFLIHMVAIILGLLIAIGLEQSVEAIHNHYLRTQLEQDVRAEARSNVEILSNHLEKNIPTMLWYRAAAIAVRSAVPRDGYIDVTLPPAPPTGVTASGLLAPERYIIPIARSSGAIALLPRSVAEVYARLDFHAEEDEKEVDHIRDDQAALSQFVLSTGVRIDPGQHLHLTLAQRDSMVAVMSSYATGLYALLRRDNLFLNASKTIADGTEDVTGLERYLREHPQQFAPYIP
jgi:hypothetical protein